MSALRVALKDLQLLLRDPMALFWVLGFPLLFALFFGAILSGGLERETAQLRVLVTDAADTPASRQLLEQLESSAALDVERAQLEPGLAEVRKGEAVALVHVPPGFGSDAGVRVELGMDPSRAVESTLLEQLLGSAVVRQVSDAAPGPVGVVRRDVLGTRRSAFEIVFPAAVMWGLIGCAAAFAVSLVTERHAGTLQRLRVAPLGWGAILGGKALACGFACGVTAAVLIVFGRLALGVRLDNLAGLASALLAVVVCFVGITMALSVLGKTVQSVAGAGWSTLIVMSMLGGGMVPLSLMPSWLDNVSVLSPVRWGIVALEGATWRGFGPAELLVPCAVLVGVGVVGFSIGVLGLRREAAA